MRLLMIAPPDFTVSATTGGSVELSLYQIAKRLSRQHAITIISRRSSRLPIISRDGNLTIIRVPGGDNYLIHVINKIKSLTYDAIQVENRPSYIPRLRRAFPKATIVLSLHSLIYMGFLSRSNQLRAVKSASAILCNSHFIRREFSKQFPQFKAKFHTIHLGVDLERFRKPTSKEKVYERKKYGIKDSAFTILYAGRIIHRKGMETLIKAARIVRRSFPFVEVVLVGPCGRKYKAELMRLAKQEKLPLLFTGKIRPSEMHRAYWLGDCFVLATQFQEAFGLVNIEAMASEVPVIASRRGGVVEIINDRNGILISDYKNPVSFARAIERIITSPELRSSLIYEGKKRVHAFDWNQTARNYEQFYIVRLNRISA